MRRKNTVPPISSLLLSIFFSSLIIYSLPLFRSASLLFSLILRADTSMAMVPKLMENEGL